MLFRKLTIAVLVLAMCPAASELLEVSVHLVRFGHFAHAGGDDHGETSPNEEHGCSELFHRCSCHGQVVPVIRHADLEIARAAAGAAVVHVPVGAWVGRDAPEPLLQPPIAARV